MSVLVVGLSHRSAPVRVLDRAALTVEACEKLLQDVTGADHVAEALVLATCNRVEVYADVDKFHGGVAAVSELLSRHTGLSHDELTDHLYVHYEDRAVQHLFTVACGLESMAVGEAQILGQVKSALGLAQRRATVGRVLNELVQQALRVGKRAHSETEIDRVSRSLVTVGLAAAAQTLGTVAGRPALVIGAGSMSALIAASLRRAGAGTITVANRTYERGARVAAAVGGQAISLDRVDEALAAADVVVSCTGAAGVVVTADRLSEATAGRQEPLFVLDLALPRDVDPAAQQLDGVTVVGLEQLAEALAHDEHAPDVEAVRRIVADEVAAFTAWQRSVGAAPTVVALRAKAAGLVHAELDRLEGRLPNLDERARDEIARTVHRVVDKLLHEPTVRVKELAGMAGGVTYTDALRELFDLDPKAPEVVSRADPAGEGGDR